MGNINLVTSKETDVFIETEVKYLKSIGYKISKVDFVNYILGDIYLNNNKTLQYRDVVIEILEQQKKDKSKRFNDILGGVKNG